MMLEDQRYKLYRAKDLCAILGITRTTLTRWRKLGEFPNPIKIGPKTSAWSADEIHDWIAQHVRLRDQSQPGGV
jgi:prophage regulatory protein